MTQQDSDHRAVSAASSPFGLLGRLSVMMFLQYFVQGCYLPIASLYVRDTLGFTPMEVGIFGSTRFLPVRFAV